MKWDNLGHKWSFLGSNGQLRAAMQLQLRAEIKQVRAGKGQHKAEMGKLGQKHNANLSLLANLCLC